MIFAAYCTANEVPVRMRIQYKCLVPIYVSLFWELRGLSPNFYIHVSVSDLYIPRIGPCIWLQQN